MRYTNSNPLILIIDPNDSSQIYFSKLLKTNGYDFMSAICISEAIQKLVEHLPQIIICNYQLENTDAFQAYNILENSILKNATPFLVIMEEKSVDAIELGLELGIDNFIFMPYNDDIILKKIKLLLKKVKELKALDMERFQKLFDDSPIGIVVIADNLIEKANKSFLKLIGIDETVLTKKYLSDYFDLESNEKELMKLKNCLKGLAKNCSIKNIRIKNSEKFVDIYVSHYAAFTKNKVIVQFVEHKNADTSNTKLRLQWIDEENTQTQRDRNGAAAQTTGNIQKIALTKREYQITSLSAKGYQIKEIAEELQLSSRTVEKHRSNIMRKTGANSIIEAIAKVAELQNN